MAPCKMQPPPYQVNPHIVNALRVYTHKQTHIYATPIRLFHSRCHVLTVCMMYHMNAGGCHVGSDHMLRWHHVQEHFYTFNIVK